MKKILLAILAITLSMTAFADDPHHDPEDIIIYETTVEQTIIEQTIIEQTVVENNIIVGNAISMAMGQHHFDYGTYAYQKSVAAATIEGSVAISGAFAHRDCRDCGLFSMSIGLEQTNNKTDIGVGVGLGYTWY